MISKKAQNLSSASHIHKSLQAGQDGERRFYDSCKAANIDIKKTSPKDDIYNHLDFFVDGKSFDVKGIKDSHRNGNLLLELKNVQGKVGWCNDKVIVIFESVKGHVARAHHFVKFLARSNTHYLNWYTWCHGFG